MTSPDAGPPLAVLLCGNRQPAVGAVGLHHPLTIPYDPLSYHIEWQYRRILSIYICLCGVKVANTITCPCWCDLRDFCYCWSDCDYCMDTTYCHSANVGDCHDMTYCHFNKTATAMMVTYCQ